MSTYACAMNLNEPHPFLLHYTSHTWQPSRLEQSSAILWFRYTTGTDWWSYMHTNVHISRSQYIIGNEHGIHRWVIAHILPHWLTHTFDTQGSFESLYALHLTPVTYRLQMPCQLLNHHSPTCLTKLWVYISVYAPPMILASSMVAQLKWHSTTQPYAITMAALRQLYHHSTCSCSFPISLLHLNHQACWDMQGQ